MASKLKGKIVKDYTFEDTLTLYQQNLEITQALKGQKVPVSIYAIHRSLVDPKTFPSFNNQIAENNQRIFPAYYEVVQSQNFIYMVFENLVKPMGKNPHKLAFQLQKILLNCPYKLSRKEIFEKNNESQELCVIPIYSTNERNSSNIYSKFHNKSVLSELFADVCHISNKKQFTSMAIQNFQSKDFWKKIQKYFKKEQSKPQNKKSFFTSVIDVFKSKTHFQQPENKKSIMKQAENQYPDIDDQEFQELMAQVHVNPSLKQQAGNAYMRQSSRTRQEETSKNQITSIFQNMKESVFDIKYQQKGKEKKSKVQIKLNERKMQKNSFEVYYQAYTQIFELFKKTIRSYLQKYHNGFAGIIAAYLLTLIGILKRLQLYRDLSLNVDIFDIGPYVSSMNFNNQINELKRQLAKQSKILVNLKSVIENSNMPYKTYEALQPFLEEDFELVDQSHLQNFCFFYLTVLLRMNGGKTYHQILAMETMYVLINEGYEIVFSEEDLPKSWDADYYELKKALIYASVPQWQI